MWRAGRAHEPSLKLKSYMLTRCTMCSRTVVDDVACTQSTLSQEDGSTILYIGMRDVTREVSMHCNICHRTVFVLEDSPAVLQNRSDRWYCSHTFISVYVCVWAGLLGKFLYSLDLCRQQFRVEVHLVCSVEVKTCQRAFLFLGWARLAKVSCWTIPRSLLLFDPQQAQAHFILSGTSRNDT